MSTLKILNVFHLLLIFYINLLTIKLLIIELRLLATIAGLVAGALSMAAGEYVSVSSQTDTEKADIAREAQELKDMPEEELQILATIYEQRGLSKETAMQVALELTAKDALAAHVRDELGINEISQANPIQAALASGAAFTLGGVLPLLVALFFPIGGMEYALYGFFYCIFNCFGNNCCEDRWFEYSKSNR